MYCDGMGRNNLKPELFCKQYYQQIRDVAISPKLLIILTMIFLMLFLTGLSLLLRNIFRSYRHKLELYQTLLVDFIPDNLVEVAVKYQPEDPIIMEESSNYDETSYQESSRPGRKNQYVPYIPQYER